MNNPSRTALLTATILLAACAGQQTIDSDRSPTAWPDFPTASRDETVYRVDEEESLLLVRVDPAGPMADLGHSHVVGGAVLSGRVVAGSAGTGRLDLRIDVNALEVDRPEWRRAHGLDPELEASAVEGTESNMKSERVLNAEDHPFVAVRSVDSTGPAWLPEITLRIRLRGRVAEYTVPVALKRGGNRLEAVAAFDARHSDFGLQPFSAAGGALRVADRIRIRVRIVAVADGRDVAIIAGSPRYAEMYP
ncbi:MAG: YceI family protein [Candidatus Wenzhouxiangella sp. M2_3B_020]